MANCPIANPLEHPVLVTLHGLDRSRLPPHTFPGSTFHSARQANTKLEPPVIIVADAQQHFELLQIGHFILEVADEGIPVLRSIIVECRSRFPALLLDAPQVVGQAVRDLHESLIHLPDRDLEHVFRANVGLSTGLELQRYVTFM